MSDGLAEEKLARIRQWCDAYPTDIFRPVTDMELKMIAEMLKASKVTTMDALYAQWARHILQGIKDILDDKE